MTRPTTSVNFVELQFFDKCRGVILLPGQPKQKTKKAKNTHMTYSSSVSVSRRQYLRRNQNSITQKSKVKALGPVSNAVILIVLACLIGLLYLTQVTKTNSYGYKINALEQEKTQLQEQKTSLEVSAARLQSLERVKNSEVAKSLVPVSPSGSVN